MNRLEIAVHLAPMFKHKFDYSDIKEDSRRIAELAFAQADALIEFGSKNPGTEPPQPVPYFTSGYSQVGEPQNMPFVVTTSTTDEVKK